MIDSIMKVLKAATHNINVTMAAEEFFEIFSDLISLQINIGKSVIGYFDSVLMELGTLKDIVFALVFNLVFVNGLILAGSFGRTVKIDPHFDESDVVVSYELLSDIDQMNIIYRILFAIFHSVLVVLCAVLVLIMTLIEIGLNLVGLTLCP